MSADISGTFQTHALLLLFLRLTGLPNGSLLLWTQHPINSCGKKTHFLAGVSLYVGLEDFAFISKGFTLTAIGEGDADEVLVETVLLFAKNKHIG